MSALESYKVDFPPIEPALEFAFEVRLRFDRTPSIKNGPLGGDRGYVQVGTGVFEGPQIKGKVIPNSGGDYAHFRLDGTVSFDARYILETDDGTRILLYNRGYNYLRSNEVAEMWERIKSGKSKEVISPDMYYFRTFPSFETDMSSNHEWLCRHVFVGSGARSLDGNVIRYYKVV